MRPRSGLRSQRPTLLVATAAIGAGIGIDFGLIAEIQDIFGFSANQIGLISGGSFVAALISTVWIAPLADRGLERPMLLAAVMLVFLAMVWMTAATAAWEWVLARCGVGIAQGILAGAGRRLALSWDTENRGKALSDQFAAGVGGFVFGAVVGPIAAEVRLDYAFLLPAALALLVAPFVWKLRTGPLPTTRTTVHRAAVIRSPTMSIGLLVVSAHALLVGTVDATWSRMLADRGADLRFIGLGFLITIGPAVVLAPFGGRWADRANPIRLAMAALFVEAAVVVAMGMSSTRTTLLLIGGAQAVVYSVLVPAAFATVAKTSPPERLATAMSTLEVSSLIAGFVGAIVSPSIYESAGPRWLYGGIGLWFGAVGFGIWLTRKRLLPAFEAEAFRCSTVLQRGDVAPI